MASKSISTLAIVIVCILLLPIGIGIFGSFFGLIFGLIGGLIGIVAAIFGALFSVIGWIIRVPLSIFHVPFFHTNFVAICLIVLVIVLLTKKSKN